MNPDALKAIVSVASLCLVGWAYSAAQKARAETSDTKMFGVSVRSLGLARGMFLCDALAVFGVSTIPWLFGWLAFWRNQEFSDPDLVRLTLVSADLNSMLHLLVCYLLFSASRFRSVFVESAGRVVFVVGAALLSLSLLVPLPLAPLASLALSTFSLSCLGCSMLHVGASWRTMVAIIAFAAMQVVAYSEVLPFSASGERQAFPGAAPFSHAVPLNLSRAWFVSAVVVALGGESRRHLDLYPSPSSVSPGYRFVVQAWLVVVILLIGMVFAMDAIPSSDALAVGRSEGAGPNSNFLSEQETERSVLWSTAILVAAGVVVWAASVDPTKGGRMKPRG